MENYKNEILDDFRMKVKNINFRDNVAQTPDNSSSSIISNLIFKYKYRQAYDTTERHIEKENKRIDEFNKMMPHLLEKLNDYLNSKN